MSGEGLGSLSSSCKPLILRIVKLTNWCYTQYLFSPSHVNMWREPLPSEVQQSVYSGSVKVLCTREFFSTHHINRFKVLPAVRLPPAESAPEYTGADQCKKLEQTVRNQKRTKLGQVEKCTPSGRCKEHIGKPPLEGTARRGPLCELYHLQGLILLLPGSSAFGLPIPS